MSSIYKLEANKRFSLLFRLLQMSPSYELARRFRAGERSKKFRASLPTDFAEVLATYDRFGDVTKTHVFDWINFVCLSHFAPDAHEDAVMNLGNLSAGGSKEDLNDILRNLNAFSKELNSRKSSPIYGIFLVNQEAGMPRLIREFKSQFIWHKSDVLKLNRQRYSASASELTLHKERLHIEKLKAGIKLLELKVKDPMIVNWRLGYKAKFSKTLVTRIANVNNVYEAIDVQLSKVELGKTTYRALRKFERIAENSARGRFPSDAAVEFLNFDYFEIALRLKAYDSWKKSDAGKNSGVFNKLSAMLGD